MKDFVISKVEIAISMISYLCVYSAYDFLIALLSLIFI